MPSSRLQPPPERSPANPACGASPAGLSVYYDGGCPLCRAEIATYQRADATASLQWVDAHACANDDLGAGLERPTALARLHVRRADGALVQGAAAFVEIWSVLPHWKWLARLARWPGMLPLLELGYRAFLKLRPLWRPARHASDGLPRQLLQDLRTDHAGETGAVMIYRGVLAVTRDRTLRDFAFHHREAELRHLALMEELLPHRRRSRLLPLWRLSGWLTGALPACIGPRAVYATIEAVETFVDHHYAAQLDMIDACLHQRPVVGGGANAGTDADAKASTSAVKAATPDIDPETRSALLSVRALLEQCRLDEVAHRDDAGARWDGRANGPLAAWRFLVAHGSSAAVRLCRHV